MIDEPVVNASGRLKKPNSAVEKRIRSLLSFSSTAATSAANRTKYVSRRPTTVLHVDRIALHAGKAQQGGGIAAVQRQRHAVAGPGAQGATVELDEHVSRRAELFEQGFGEGM